MRGMPRTAPRCPRPDEHYRTEVNKDSINMRAWSRHLNDQYQRGYRLAHVFEQDGNTVQVYEHHWHDDGFDSV
jgi:hypothetical protein